MPRGGPRGGGGYRGGGGGSGRGGGSGGGGPGKRAMDMRFFVHDPGSSTP